MSQLLGDGDGDFDWPAELIPYSLAPPEVCVDKFEEKTLPKAKEHELSHKICNEFKVVLRNIASIQDMNSTIPANRSHAESIFEDIENVVKTNPSLNLLHIAIELASHLKNAGISDAKYFELFNILFGLPQITFDLISQLDSLQLLHILVQHSDHAKHMPASISAINRKRRLQLFIDKHIIDAVPLNEDSLNASKTEYDHELNRRLNESMKISELTNNLDEKHVIPNSRPSSKIVHIRNSLSNFNKDFIASFLTVLQNVDRSEPLQKVFAEELKVSGVPVFKRKGDDVIFELLRLYQQVTEHARVDIDMQFNINDTTASILRWMIGQYFRSPLSVLPPIDPSIAVSFNIQTFSNIEVLNLCTELKKYNQVFEQLLVLSFSQFDQCERQAWNNCINLIIPDAAHLLHDDPDLKRIAFNVGIPKKAIDSVLAQYCISQRKYEQAISYLIDSDNYDKALNIFLKTQISTLVSSQSHTRFSYLPLFIDATCKAYRSRSTRRIVDVLAIYFQFTEYIELHNLDVSELNRYIKELLSKMPDTNTCNPDEIKAVAVIVNDVIRKSAIAEVHHVDGAGMVNLIDDDIVNMLASNKSICDIVAIDSRLAQRIVDVNGRLNN